MANKSGKKTIVLASGVFDLLHLGHVRFLEGKKPIMSEEQRCALVESLKVVDRTVLGHESLDIGEVIENIKPNVIALGYDQEKMEHQVRNYVDSHKSCVKIVRIGKFAENTLDSSSKIKQKIIDKLAKN